VATKPKEEKSSELKLNTVAVIGNLPTVTYNESAVEEANRPRCRALVSKVKTNLSRILSAAIDAGENLKELHSLMPHDDFVDLCNNEFKISHSTAWRYMKAFDYVAINYSEDERLNLIPRFNLSAIEFLSTTKEIITPEQVREIADSTEDGKLVSRKALEGLIAELEETAGEQLAIIEDLKKETAAATQLAMNYKNQATTLELQAERNQMTLSNRTTEISGLMQEVQDKTKLLSEMRKQLEEKQEPIAMLPAEYTSLADAVQKLEGDLHDLKSKETKLRDTIQALEAEARIANGALQDSKSLQTALASFIHDMQMLTNKHDATVIGNAFKAANDKTKDTVLGLIAQVKELDIAVAA
jgi:myosin heavy subunit